MTNAKHRTLIIVHVATRRGILPNGTPWEYELAEYDDFAIGTGTTLGRIFHALHLAQAAKEAKLYITLPPNELPEMADDGFQGLIQRAQERLQLHAVELIDHFGFDIAMACELLDGAYVDDWADAKDLGDPMNTAGEAIRAARFAQAHGYGIIQPVSTGWGHSPRCGATDFAQAEKDGLVVAGYASVPFPGLAGQQAAIIDPPHLKDAAFAQMEPEYQLHKLMATVFVVGLDRDKSYDEKVTTFNSIAHTMVDWLETNGRTTNAMGEKL